MKSPPPSDTTDGGECCPSQCHSHCHLHHSRWNHPSETPASGILASLRWMTEQFVGAVHGSSHIDSQYNPHHQDTSGLEVEKEGGFHLYSHAEVMIHKGARFFWWCICLGVTCSCKYPLYVCPINSMSWNQLPRLLSCCSKEYHEKRNLRKTGVFILSQSSRMQSITVGKSQRRDLRKRVIELTVKKHKVTMTKVCCHSAFFLHLHSSGPDREWCHP